MGTYTLTMEQIRLKPGKYPGKWSGWVVEVYGIVEIQMPIGVRGIDIPVVVTIDQNADITVEELP